MLYEPPGVHFALAEATDHSPLIALEGEIDVASAPDLRRRLGALPTPPNGLVVLDLDQLWLIDCTAGRELATFARSASRHGCRVVFARPQPIVRTVLELLGLRSAIEVSPTTEEEAYVPELATVPDQAPPDHIALGQFPQHLSSVDDAEHFVTSACRELVTPTTLDSMAILVAELVANAVMHAKSRLWVHVARGDEELTVAVTDEGPGAPVLRRSDPDDPVPSGLNLVDQLAASWGVRWAGGTKTVWFTVRCR
jgi:anti-anti-sigma factor